MLPQRLADYVDELNRRDRVHLAPAPRMPWAAIAICVAVGCVVWFLILTRG